jgi:dihydroorotase-like cyclic amidohydrolase
MLTAVHAERLTLDRMVEMMHTAPAGVFGVPRQQDTFTEVDTEKSWRIRADDLQSRCGWTPFDGMSVTGSVERVVVRGREVVSSGRVVVPGSGTVLRPVDHEPERPRRG